MVSIGLVYGVPQRVVGPQTSLNTILAIPHVAWYKTHGFSYLKSEQGRHRDFEIYETHCSQPPSLICPETGAAAYQSEKGPDF